MEVTSLMQESHWLQAFQPEMIPATDSEATVDDEVISEGETVIVRVNDASWMTILKSGGDQKIWKSRICVDALVGAPYGSIFEINSRRLVRMPDEGNFDADAAEFAESGGDNLCEGKECVVDVIEERTDREQILSSGSFKVDNRSFIDSNTAQKLKDADIQSLRESGASGAEIIKSLIANSDTWSTKTGFAQEKWLQRKRKKYIRRLRVVKCNPATLCEVYHTKNREKICGLRPDTLAQILSQSGIHAGSRVLVFESVVGLVVGAVAYRLRGNGRILAAYTGQQPHFELVHALNLDHISVSIIQPTPSTELGPAAAHIRQHGFSTTIDDAVDGPLCSRDDGIITKELQTKKVKPNIECCVVDLAPTDHSTTETDAQLESRPYNRSGRQAQDLLRVQQYLKEGVDSLIIASRFAPLPILKEAITLLAPSSPFVVFCEFMEPLVECYLYLQTSSLALRLVLADTWKREFQTLPGRVHPEMFMSTSGGFILSGIYIGVPPLSSLPV